MADDYQDLVISLIDGTPIKGSTFRSTKYEWLFGISGVPR
jgi:hypothetical protein